MFVVFYDEEFKTFNTEEEAKAYAEVVIRSLATTGRNSLVYIYRLRVGLAIEPMVWFAHGCPDLPLIEDEDEFFCRLYGRQS